MIEFGVDGADLARLRFGYSPLAEVVAGVRLVHAGSRAQAEVYRDWVATAHGRLGPVRMDLLGALLAGPAVPGFLSPPPRRLGEPLAEELATVTGTDPAVARRDLEHAHAGRQIPPLLQPLHADPDRHLDTIADELNNFWHAAIAPHWPRIHAIATADISHRLEQFSHGGVAHLLTHLHPDLRFAPTRLTLHGSSDATTTLGGHGLILAPCVLGWPTIRPARRTNHHHSDTGGDPDPQALFYPPRGIAALQTPHQPHPTQPASWILGHTRTALLTSLEAPRTTSELAHQLHLSPGAISQQLKLLHHTALVDRHRRGREVYYQRTTTGSTLLNATPTGDHTTPTARPGTPG
jgi:DNA-binding transcriptional ArsR family regulator